MKYMVTLNGKKYEIEVEEGQAIVNKMCIRDSIMGAIGHSRLAHIHILG